MPFQGLHRSASMRPRPSCRGEPGIAGCKLFDRQPLQCGHGLRAVENYCCRLPKTCTKECFNAATAFVPWRTSAGPSWRRFDWMLQCGHGLRAVENLQSPCHIMCHDAVASMRPRPSCRGERSADGGLGSAGCTLQCGHGLRAVENEAHFATVRAWADALQCGHGLRAVENGRLVRRHRALLIRASMRPRPSCRGEPRMLVGNDSLTAASMRPRPSCRGEPVTRSGPAPRQPASMRPRPSCRGELCYHRQLATSAGRLQCGHGLRAVENVGFGR